jgi:hypothetical protein
MLEVLNNLNTYLMNWYLGVPESPIKDIDKTSKRVRNGAMIEAAMKSMGLAKEDLIGFRETFAATKRFGTYLEIFLQTTSLGVGFGTEYYIDRRKNFSFLKAFMYYMATFGFLNASINTYIITTGINQVDEALNSFT